MLQIIWTFWIYWLLSFIMSENFSAIRYSTILLCHSLPSGRILNVHLIYSVHLSCSHFYFILCIAFLMISWILYSKSFILLLTDLISCQSTVLIFLLLDNLYFCQFFVFRKKFSLVILYSLLLLIIFSIPSF